MNVNEILNVAMILTLAGAITYWSMWTYME